MGGGGEGRRFSYLLESHMTYLAGSHVLRSWAGIRLKVYIRDLFSFLVFVIPNTVSWKTPSKYITVQENAVSKIGL